MHSILSARLLLNLREASGTDLQRQRTQASEVGGSIVFQSSPREMRTYETITSHHEEWIGMSNLSTTEADKRRNGDDSAVDGLDEQDASFWFANVKSSGADDTRPNDPNPNAVNRDPKRKIIQLKT
jgi:hypothetical protein